MADTGLHFGDCEIDLATSELRVASKPRAIEPKAFDLLAYLVQHRDRVVSKNELQDAIWPGMVVTETSLTRTVMKARKAVGDDAHAQRVIKTVPRRGYRFVADLAEQRRDPFSAEPPGLGPVQFVRSGDVHIAWRTLGEGPVDILFVPGFVSHLDIRYRIAPVARFDARLSEMGRLIVFDKRGVGLSDRIGYPPTLEHTVDDMRAVLDAAGAERAVLLGVSESGPATALFAATYPQRTRAIIMYGTFAKGLRSEDYPWAASRKRYDAWLDSLIAEWGGPASVEYFAPSMADNPEFRDGWARYLRAAATPGSIRDVLEVLRDIDVRDVLPAVKAPTLVLHRKGDRMMRYEAGEDMAARIPGAQFRLLEGDDHWWWIGDSDAVLREIKIFLEALEPVTDSEAVLATLLALDLANGDDAFRQSVCETIDHQRGRLVTSDGGQLLAVFDGPSRALRCARTIRDRGIANNVGVRAGLHASEVVLGQHEVTGPAVRVAGELMRRAEPGQVLATGTLRDLVAGSGMQLEPCEVTGFAGECCCLD
jgi:DNA-binding winged helix-turn-helix (wHTH) protein/pimeloyl-ACP methyl ester carboxylesterase